MNWYKLAIKKNALLREAETAEHKAIRETLDAWAAKLGYSPCESPLPPNILADAPKPDVHRQKDDGRDRFIGDAKFEASETSDRFKSWLRISGYAEGLATLIEQGAVTCGIFAVATDDIDAANGWAAKLEVKFWELGLRRQDDLPIRFVVERISDIYIAHSQEK